MADYWQNAADGISQKKRLEDSILRLHEWRERFNGEDIGYGHDEYVPQKTHHYAEAYGIFGHAYLNLYRVSGEEAYLGLARRSAEWLTKNPSPRYENLSWGLPWKWEQWDAPADLSYLITTALVGAFLIGLYETTGETVYLDQCLSVAKWILEENGYVEREDGLLFFYANHPPLRIPVLNPSVVASYFLAKMGVLTGEKKVRDISERGFEYAVRNQNRDGSWHYSERKRYPDNFHTALVLEALKEYLRLFPLNQRVQTCLEKGLRFYRRNLFTRKGIGMDLLPPVAKRLRPIHIYRKYVSGIPRLAPARLWSYGAAIRVFSKQDPGTGFPTFCSKVVEHVLEDLQLPSGAFRYRLEDERTFVRHEAHIFHGLATLLQEGQRQSRGLQ